MKQITLRTLTLRNWRGEKERTTDFATGGQPTYICGGNGLGKSRHFDAFCWLLFGKDSQDRKDYELRTHDADGNVLHRVECSVEATISIDGDDHTIKREYKEQWVKPRGQVEEVFKGNVTECTWDGVPVKVNEFQRRVQEHIIDDTLFKMLTNPRYFCERIKWQQQRECLLQMAGTTPDEDIAADKPEYRQLLDALKGKSLADYRKEVAAEKKRLKSQLAEVQPRIDQTHRMMPESEDWSELEEERETKLNTISVIDKQISSSGERDKAREAECAETQQRIYALQNEQRQLMYAYKQKAEKEAYERNEERRSVEAKLKSANTELTTLNIDRKHAADRITYIKNEINSLEKQLVDMRHEWQEINSASYDGSSVCPHCGQSLPDHMVKSAEDDFRRHKAERLAANNARGKALAEQLKCYSTELREKEVELTSIDGDITTKENLLSALYDDLNAHPIATPVDVKPEDISSWRERQEEIGKFQSKLEKLHSMRSNLSDDAALKELQARRKEEQAEVDALNGRLAKRGLIDAAKAEISRLQEEGRLLAQQIADIEKREYVANDFSKRKIEDCESRINSMFERVRFRLFDVTQDGNEFETCIPMVDGIPYSTTNTAGQLNAGLDIIRTLCRFNNVCAPIFIDNAESVNEFLPVPSQYIFLKVTQDTELVII